MIPADDTFRRALAPLMALALLAFPGGVAAAQMSMSASAGSGGEVLIEESRVVANATTAFEAATDARLAEADIAARWRGDARAAVNAARQRYASELRSLINELKGDGVLEAGEVTDGVGALRDRVLDELERDLKALEAGYPVPPQRDAYASRWSYAAAMTRYTVTERNDGTDWLVLVGAIGGGFVLAWLVSMSLGAVARRLRKRQRRHLAHMIDSLSGPLYLVIVALAVRLGFEWMWIPGLAGEVIDRVVTTGWIAALFWFVWNVCHTLARGIVWVLRKTYNKDFDEHVVLILSRVLRIVALAVFTLLVVQHIFDSSLTGLVAGLGIVGVALSFILRGTIENIAASFTILGDKPFRVGDLIVHDDIWGSVEHIGFRSTRLRTLEGHLLTIPNSKLIDNDIHNAGARPSIRRRFRIGLTYDTPPEKIEQAMDIVREILSDHRGQPDGQKPRVVFETFGDYDLRLMVQYHFEPADYWKALEFDTEVNLEIKRRFDEAGIEFAFPTRTLHVQPAHALEDAGRDERKMASEEQALA